MRASPQSSLTSLSTSLVIVSACAVFAAACAGVKGGPGSSGSGGTGGVIVPPPIQGLKSLDIMPDSQSVSLNPVPGMSVFAPAAATYQAIGSFEDGHTEDVSN